MGIKNRTMSFPVVAGQDLSTYQHRLVSVAGTLAVDGEDAIGALVNKPESGQMAEVEALGLMKGVAGAAIAAGARLKVQSGGWLITVTSGLATVGKNTNVAVSSGEHFGFYGNFLNSGLAVTSNGI